MSLIVDKKDRIAFITIDRPESFNALDANTVQELRDTWLDIKDDPDVWVIIITGAGEKAFCTGADLKEFMPKMTAGTSPIKEEFHQAFLKGIDLWKPIIAAVNGHALAGGTELALACDLRIASENATFGLTEVKWGLIPGMGGTQRLPRTIPMALAMEMLLIGKRIDALEAYRIGMVNKVVPLVDLIPTAKKMAEDICENSPIAVRALKEVVIRGLDMSLEQGMDIESQMVERILLTDDPKEGLRAFAEKRKPQFKGS